MSQQNEQKQQHQQKQMGQHETDREPQKPTEQVHCPQCLAEQDVQCAGMHWCVRCQAALPVDEGGHVATTTNESTLSDLQCAEDDVVFPWHHAAAWNPFEDVILRTEFAVQDIWQKPTGLLQEINADLDACLCSVSQELVSQELVSQELVSQETE